MNKKEKKNTLKRTFVEWGVILTVVLLLYLTGLHTPVIGFMQRIILETRLLQPNKIEVPSDQYSGTYSMPLTSFSGQSENLMQYEGKTVFINFWATWCPPCIAEMPDIQKLYDHFKQDTSFQFLMVSLDQDQQKARDFIERKEFTFPVYFLNGQKPAVFNTSVIPSTYVIDPMGNIVVKEQGMAKYNTTDFRNFLKNL